MKGKSRRPAGEWKTVEHALSYLERADRIPHRTEGEATLLSEVPAGARRILDLGTGDGRLLALILLHCPGARGIALDYSPPMLERAAARFAGTRRVEVRAHDLADPLPALGAFDVVSSSFAIHHLPHPRKRTLYGEIAEILRPGGIFCNLEHVLPASDRLHQSYLRDMGITRAQEDPSNILLEVETQLGWLRRAGLEDVDCIWKWREFALLVGRKPRRRTSLRKAPARPPRTR